MKQIILAISLIFQFSFLHAQQDESYYLSREQLEEDVQFLEDLIFDAHLALHYVCDTNKLRTDFTQVKEMLRDSMQASELYAMLAPVFYQIQDVHCALNLPLSSNDYYLSGSLYLPLTVIMQDTSMYISSNYQNKLPAAGRILSINNYPTDSIMKVLKKASASDGNNDHTREKFASLFFPNLFPLFFNVDSINNIVYVYESDTIEKEIEGLSRRNHLVNSWFLDQFPEEKKIFRFGYSKDLNTAYMKIGSFIGGTIGEYNRFLRHSFAYIHSYNADCLILDLRDNPGGYSNRGKLLTRYLMPDKFTYIHNIISKSSDIVRNEMLRHSTFQVEIMKFIYRTFSNKPLRTIWKKPNGYVDTTEQKMVKPMPPRLCFDKKLLIVMMNGLSASTSGLVFNTLRKRPNTVFLGQPAACTIDGTFGQPVEFQLPNSGINGQISILRFNQVQGTPSMQPIIPDIEVKQNIEDFLKGSDTQLQYVIDFIKSKQKK